MDYEIEYIFHLKLYIELVVMVIIVLFYTFIFKLRTFFGIVFYKKVKEIIDAKFEFEVEELFEINYTYNHAVRRLWNYRRREK